MKKDMWIMVNGKIIPELNAMIPISDPGFLFGEGVFTSIRVSNGVCEFLNQHIQRLYSHAEFLGLNQPEISIDQINELILLNQAGCGVWKLKLILTAKNFIVTLEPYIMNFKSVKLCLFPLPFQSPLSEIKSLSYGNHRYIKDYAKKLNYDDAITSTKEGFLLETSSANLFWIDKSGCWIPDLTLPYLKGVVLEQLIKNLKIPVHFIKSTLLDVPAKANVYLCNSMIHIQSVTHIEQQNFKKNENTEKLLKNIILKTTQSKISKVG